jgi:hypothetical protein
MVSKALLSFLLVANTSDAFLINPLDSKSSSAVVLFGAKNSKRGRLGNLAADGVVITPSKTRVNKKKTSSAAADGSEISPALAEWMGKQDGSNSAVETAPTEDTTGDETASFSEEFQEPAELKGKQNRRVKQGVRKEQDEKRDAILDQAVDALEEALEKKGNLDGILTAVRGLMKLDSGNLKTILSSKTRSDYRLAWVGSDDAICHIGTGLHKVPLARLQEVFMSCLGRNRLEIIEVISIFGPFPNVRNVLQGSTKLGKGAIDTLNIVIDSMVDGTGKEILAGTEESIRRVDLQIYFCDERAIVGVVPPENGGARGDALESDGSNVLVFLREEELDDKLDQMRVS